MDPEILNPELETSLPEALDGYVEAPTVESQIDDVRYTFTEETFREAMETYGPENTARALIQRASATQPPEMQFTLDSLQTGKDPILDLFPLTKDMSEEERRKYFSNPEAALMLLSNMEDFGKYDPKSNRLSGLEAMADSFARFIPEGIGMSEGALIGARLMKSTADKMQPRTPMGYLAKLGTYGLGIIPGMFIGQKVGEEVGDYAFGEPVPVAPSLLAYTNFGETTALGANPSSLSQSFRWTKDMNWLGASKFLENYRSVSAGRLLNSSTNVTQASSGLGPTQFAAAVKSAAGRPFFSGKVGFDPSLGPKSMRTLGAIEKGVATASERAFAAPFSSPVLEAISAGGAGVGAFVAESFRPGSEGWRFAGELGGSMAPGPVISAVTRGGSAGYTRIKDLFTRMATDDSVGDLKRTIGMERILKSIESNPDFTGEDMLKIFLEEIENSPQTGEKIPVSLFAASKNSPLTKILNGIDLNLGTVSDELEAATEKGREQFLANAKAAVMALKDEGSPEAVQLASTLQKGMFEESLQSEMSSRLNLFYQSLEAVTGGDPKALQKYDISNLLYERLTKFMGDVKERETVFWNEVGDYELTNFSEDNLPNMLKIFDVPYPTNEGGGLKFSSETLKAQFWANLPKGTGKDLKLIFNYFGKNIDGTPLGQQDGTSATAKISPTLSKAYDKFQETADSLAGTQTAVQLRSIEDRAKQITDVNERVSFLRTEADSLREESAAVSRTGLGEGTGRRDLALATGLDRLATIELLRAREDTSIRLDAGAIDGEEVENPLTAQRLFDIRSALLSASASLNKNKDPRSGGRQTAASMSRMAEAVLTDLLSEDTASEPYNLARAYTLASRDVAERSFLGGFKDLDVKGRPVVTPENALDYVFKRGGSDVVTLRLKEMDAARQFINSEMGLTEEAATIQVGDIDASIKSALQYAISRITKEVPNPQDSGEMISVIDTTKLKNFKDDPKNIDLLSRFPTIARGLGTAEDAQNIVSTLGENVKFFNTSNDVLALNSVIATGEKSGLIAANAINSTEPFQQLKFLINLVKEQKTVSISPSGDVTTITSARGPILGKNNLGEDVEFTQEQALNGLRSSILTYATTRSGNEGLKFDARTMFDTLFTKLPNMDSRSASLSKFMEQEGLMTKDQVSNMRTALKQMMNIDDAFQKGNMEQVLFKNPTKAKLLAARSLGAIMGSRGMKTFNDMLGKMGLGSGGNSMGAGMIIARGGAESAQDFFLVAPEAAINKGMIEIMQDPDMFRELTLEIQNNAQYEASNRRINSFFANLGVDQTAKRQQIIARPIIMDQTDYEQYEEPEVEVKNPKSSGGADPLGLFNPRVLPDNSQQGSVAPEQRPSPVETPTTQASAVPLLNSEPVNSAPVNRERYAALFPNDPISSMLTPTRQMARGGIASLMR